MLLVNQKKRDAKTSICSSMSRVTPLILLGQSERLHLRGVVQNVRRINKILREKCFIILLSVYTGY